MEKTVLSLNWNLNRELSKLNYKIHTDAIKEKLIIPELSPAQKSFVYADEADLLNVALFGQTALKQLRTIMGLDFSSQKILSISETGEETK